ncbi:MAG: penicillin-binding protein 2 [Pseudomonadota bacterium]
MKRGTAPLVQPWRHGLLCIALVAMAVVVLGRAWQLQVHEQDFLVKQGIARHQRTIPVPASRGRILDRNGSPLAVSTPISSVWAEPQKLRQNAEIVPRLAKSLSLEPNRLQANLDKAPESSEFMYVARHVDPRVADQVASMKIEGVHLQREFRRYYPAGEVASHVLGATNIDDRGIEGIENLWDELLAGTSGARRVMRDLKGRAFSEVEYIERERPGGELVLSLDRRIQYLAFRELKRAVETHGALSGSVVVLRAQTGEVLALANQPSFNPNAPAAKRDASRRNRAVTDPLEPGSTIKPFTIAAALQLGVVTADDVVDTAPGLYRVGRLEVKDFRDYGPLSLEEILKKSSNVGVTKVSLGADPAKMWEILDEFGFGRDTGSLFPGENFGVLRHGSNWRRIEQATISYGYGLSATPLQLARAYAALGNDGVLPEISFLKRDDADYTGRRVLEPEVARTVRRMLESVVEPGGTGERARVAGYRVAGKTGTSRKPAPGGYRDDKYYAFFAGMAPASDPELVVVVLIDEPSGQQYYGGEVAAPAFASIMAGSLRVLGVPMDAIEQPPRLAARQAPAESSL